MTNLNGNDTEMTLREAAELSGKKYDTAYRLVRRKFPEETWTADTEVPPEVAAVLIPGKSGKVRRKSAKAKSENFTPREAKPPIKEPAARSWNLPTFSEVRNWLIGVLLICGVIGHAGLVWYDCAVLWGVPGQIGGAGVFTIVTAAVLLASDADKFSTSGDALVFVFFVDLAAWWVHFEVFKTPIVSDVITGALCAFICAASFFALYLFRAFKFN